MTSSLGVGGTERRLFSLVSNLQSHKNVLVSIISFDDTGYYKNIISELDINLIIIKGSYIKRMVMLYKTFNRIKPDIVHIFTFSTIYALIIAKLTGIRKLISSFGGNYFPGNRSFDTFLLRFIYKIFDPFINLYICNSHIGKKCLLAELNLNHKKIIVINNGLDFNLMSEKKPINILPIISKNKIVGSVSNLNYDKDPLNFIESAYLVKKKYNNVDFHLIGSGNLEYKCREKIEKLGMSDYFKLYTNINQGHLVSNFFDIAVLSSRNEAFPNVLLEYMFWGKPCVVTDVGDCPIIIEQDVSGKIVARKNSREMANAILYLLSLDNKRLIKMGKASKEKLIKNYSMDIYVTNTFNVYKKIL